MKLVRGGIVVPEVSEFSFHRTLELRQLFRLHLAGLQRAATDHQLRFPAATVLLARHGHLFQRVLAGAGIEQRHEDLALADSGIIFVLLAHVVVAGIHILPHEQLHVNAALQVDIVQSADEVAELLALVLQLFGRCQEHLDCLHRILLLQFSGHKVTNSFPIGKIFRPEISVRERIS